MPIVVDAYNVLHVTGVLPPGLAGMDVADLVTVLPRTRFGGEDVVLVCDGRPGRSTPRVAGAGRVRVKYAGGERSADDLIAAIVQRSSAPRSITVVSSDREVQRAARRRRCPVLGSDDFLRRIRDDLHGEFLEALAAAESPPQPAAPPPARRKPAADPFFPADLLREAAAFELPSEPGPDAEPETELEPDAAPAPPPPPSPSPPTPAAADLEPLFSSDLLAEALELARDDASRRAEDQARQRAEDAARSADEAARAASATERASADAARAVEEQRRRDARADGLADEAGMAIGAADLAALDALLDRTIPVEDRPRKDRTFDEDILAEAESMLREFGEDPKRG